MGTAPIRARELEQAIVGQIPAGDLFRDACESCRKFDAIDDVHAPASYRQHLAAVLSRRALEKAYARLRGTEPACGAMSLSDSVQTTAIEPRGAPPPLGRGLGRGYRARETVAPHPAPLPMGEGADRIRGTRNGSAEAIIAVEAIMGEKRKIALTVNGKRYEEEVEVRWTLADFLRHQLHLTGTHLGCEHGVCGACTILLDGRSARSCLMLAVQANGHEILTVEGIAPSPDKLHPLQQAFHEHHGLQCGFCTPGMLTTLLEFLRDNPDPTEQEVRIAISGNLCRCTGYQNIVTATLDAAKRLRAEGARQGLNSSVMAGLVPAIHVFVSATT